MLSSRFMLFHYTKKKKEKKSELLKHNTRK
jgi:hypothetical protein